MFALHKKAHFMKLVNKSYNGRYVFYDVIFSGKIYVAFDSMVPPIYGWD